MKESKIVDIRIVYINEIEYGTVYINIFSMLLFIYFI